MKRVRENNLAPRIASVHNGSSLFTGDVEAKGREQHPPPHHRTTGRSFIIQLPNNFLTTPASPPTSGCSATTKALRRRMSVSSTRPNSTASCARTWGQELRACALITEASPGLPDLADGGSAWR
ncbi:MAG: hypothetical protein R2838_10525 [Caldilineaceae bacterium]